MILKQSTIYRRAFQMFLTGTQTGATGKSPLVKLGKIGPSGIVILTAANSPAVEADPGGVSGLGGIYYINFAATDLDTAGELALIATATGCDPTTFIDQVRTNVFSDLMLDSGGRIYIKSNQQQNQPLTLPFTMTVAGVPTPGLTVTGQRNFGSGWSNLAGGVGAVADLTLGDYKAALQATDTNNAVAIYRFTASGADDRNVTIIFEP